MNTVNYTCMLERLPGLSWHQNLGSTQGSPDAYLLLDVGEDEPLWASLYANQDLPGWAVESLCIGTPYQALANVGPHLVALRPDSHALAGVLERMAHAPMGAILCPGKGVAWATVVDHCRQWLTLPGPDGKPVMFRWFDPRWLRAVLTGMTEQQRQALAGPLTALIWPAADGWLQWTAAAEITPTEVVGSSLQLDARWQQQLAQERIWDNAALLARDYARYLPVEGGQGVQWLVDMLSCAQGFGYSSEADQEQWLRLRLQSTGEFWLQPEARAILTRDDLSPAEKLKAVASHCLKGTQP